MKTFLFISQIIVSLALILVIILQSKGSGLSTVFGGAGAVYRSRKGVEKLFVYITIILTALFLMLSVLQFAL